MRFGDYLLPQTILKNVQDPLEQWFGKPCSRETSFLFRGNLMGNIEQRWGPELLLLHDLSQLVRLLRECPKFIEHRSKSKTKDSGACTHLTSISLLPWMHYIILPLRQGSYGPGIPVSLLYYIVELSLLSTNDWGLSELIKQPNPADIIHN